MRVRKKPKYLLLQSHGQFVLGHGLQVRELAAKALDAVFVCGLANWLYAAIKRKKKSSYFLEKKLKTTKLPKTKQNNVSLCEDRSGA